MTLQKIRVGIKVGKETIVVASTCQCEQPRCQYMTSTSTVLGHSWCIVDHVALFTYCRCWLEHLTGFTIAPYKTAAEI